MFGGGFGRLDEFYARAVFAKMPAAFVPAFRQQFTDHIEHVLCADTRRVFRLGTIAMFLLFARLAVRANIGGQFDLLHNLVKIKTRDVMSGR